MAIPWIFLLPDWCFLLSRGLPEGELPEGQERPPWGAPVCALARNDVLIFTRSINMERTAAVRLLANRIVNFSPYCSKFHGLAWPDCGILFA